MTLQALPPFSPSKPDSVVENFHPWISKEPHYHSKYLEKEHRKLSLLSKISLIAVSLFSLSASIAAIFITSKPLLLTVTILALSSPALFYFSTEFSQQAAFVKKSLEKTTKIAKELDILKELSSSKLQQQLKTFDFHPSIPVENRLYLLARHRYLESFQNEMKEKLQQSFTCTNIPEASIKTLHRNLAWEIFTNVYLPSFLEKAFCHFVAQNPETTFYPGSLIDCHIKNFTEFSFSEKFEKDSRFLVYKNKNLKPINLWDFEELTNTLSSKELYARIFSQALSIPAATSKENTCSEFSHS